MLPEGALASTNESPAPVASDALLPAAARLGTVCSQADTDVLLSAHLLCSHAGSSPQSASSCRLTTVRSIGRSPNVGSAGSGALGGVLPPVTRRGAGPASEDCEGEPLCLGAAPAATGGGWRAAGFGSGPSAPAGAAVIAPAGTASAAGGSCSGGGSCGASAGWLLATTCMAATGDAADTVRCLRFCCSSNGAAAAPPRPCAASFTVEAPAEGAAS